MSVRLQTLTGPPLLPLLPALAQLRITVFRDWPYLYDGNDAYEQHYLRHYAESPDAMIVVAFADDRPVGASTCIPLLQAGAQICAPFTAQNLDPDSYCYFGESVLLSAWRGQGIGAAFFREREAHARKLRRFNNVTFCAVQRPADHPARPLDYVPLDQFWQNRGFSPRPDLMCRMSWLDVGDSAETQKPLMFWVKSLRTAAS